MEARAKRIEKADPAKQRAVLEILTQNGWHPVQLDGSPDQSVPIGELESLNASGGLPFMEVFAGPRAFVIQPGQLFRPSCDKGELFFPGLLIGRGTRRRSADLLDALPD
jgi:hypothetical protein